MAECQPSKLVMRVRFPPPAPGTVTDLATQVHESYTILGALDFDAEHHLISYLSPIGQAMVGKKPGEEAEFELDGMRKRFRIDAIAPYKPA